MSRTTDVFLAAFITLSVALTLTAASRFGPGISTDSVYYLSSAENLSQGNGLTDFRGMPLINWPPLYPAVLGALKALLPQDLLTIGLLLNAFLFGLLVFLSAVLMHRSLQGKAAYVLIGAGLTALSPPLLSLATNFLADVFFISLTVLFLIVSQNLLSTGRTRDLLVLTLLAALSMTLRWHGAALYATGFVITAIAYRKDLSRLMKVVPLYGIFAALPILTWVIGRNYLHFGTFLGTREGEIRPLDNLSLTLERVAHWAVPYSVMDRVPLLLLAAALVLIALLINRRARWIRLWERLTRPPVLPVPVFTLIYFTLVLLTTFTDDHPHLSDDRYQAPLYIPLVLMTILVVDELFRNHSITRRIRAEVLLVPFFAIWTLYPAFSTYKYVIESHEVGVIYYNIYNSKQFHTTPVVQFVQEYKFEDDAVLYSNLPAAAYFYTGVRSTHAPSAPDKERRTQRTLLETYRNWPNQPHAYLLWFIPNIHKVFYNPDDLRAIADLEEIYGKWSGRLYTVRPHAPSQVE